MKKEFKSKCSGCGANLEFNPEGRNLICKSCGKVFSFEISDDFAKRKINLNTYDTEDKVSKDKAVLPRCKSCGAMFTGKIIGLATRCEYCGSTLMVEDISTYPDAVVPFTFGKKTAEDRFKEGIRKKAWLPKSFKRNPNIASIESIYIPAYSFDTDVRSDYKGELYDEDKDKDGNTHRHYFNISGSVDTLVRDELVECSEHITQSELVSIEPFQISELKAFSREFICGYSVEYYNRTVEESGRLVKEVLYGRIRKQILKKYSYDGVEYLKIESSYNSSKYSYLLLPIYKFNYTYKKKKYSTIMNGQTGKIGGKMPSSVGKVLATIFGILFGLGMVAFLIYAMTSGMIQW